MIVGDDQGNLLVFNYSQILKSLWGIVDYKNLQAPKDKSTLIIPEIVWKFKHIGAIQHICLAEIKLYQMIITTSFDKKVRIFDASSGI